MALHLLLGPVGAGKSTLARQLQAQHHAARLELDAWMARLYGADERPASDRIGWYLERTARCMDVIWDVTCQLADVGADVILELGLIRRDDRRAFYQRVDDAGHPLIVYLVDAPRAIRRERVLRRNIERGPTWSVDVPPEFFELASDLWEPPDDAERAARDLRVLPGGATPPT